MMHQIVIKSAKRTYTYRRKFANKHKTNPNEIKFPGMKDFRMKDFQAEIFHAGEYDFI